MSYRGMPKKRAKILLYFYMVKSLRVFIEKSLLEVQYLTATLA